jgi:hypothetical protein
MKSLSGARAKARAAKGYHTRASVERGWGWSKAADSITSSARKPAT